MFYENTYSFLRFFESRVRISVPTFLRCHRLIFLDGKKLCETYTSLAAFGIISGPQAAFRKIDPLYQSDVLLSFEYIVVEEGDRRSKNTNLIDMSLLDSTISIVG